MATVTIHDEATREVLVRAIWNTAVAGLGNNADETVCFDYLDVQCEESRDTVATRVSEYGRWMDDLQAVESAAIGGRVEIWGEIGDAILSLRGCVADCPEHLLNAEPVERTRILELFDAAYALLPAEAVA
jgi:hypothetical protein